MMMKNVCRTVVLCISLGQVVDAAAECAAPSFVVETNPFTVEQAPVWTPDGGGFLYHKQVPGEDGVQLHTATILGENEVCLTCGQPGPNMVAQYRPPNGDWIIFHSHREKTFRIGSPGFGGTGSDLFAIRPDRTGLTRLTTSAEGQDVFHTTFSPDGNRVAFTFTNFALNEGETGSFEVRVADFVEGSNGPELQNVHTVLPPNGHFYETQHWRPDGSGFLVTETVDNMENLELHYLDLSTDPPTYTRLTDHPSWDEQAVFTPDGTKAIFMSTRDKPSGWETFAHVSRTAGLPADLDAQLLLPLFVAFFFQPIAPPGTDLYEIDIETRAVRRLTTSGDDGWIIPEFVWDPAGERLLWTEFRYQDRVRAGVPPEPAKEIAELTAPGLDPDIVNQHGGTGLVAGELRTRIGRYVCPE